MFVNPLMLTALGAAALPVVIHLLSRARYRTVDWGAMMFLAPAGASARQRTGRLREHLLLALRCLVIALLAIALARPVVYGGGDGAAAGRGPATSIILLDCSASMGFSEAGRSRFEMARDVAARVVMARQGNDRIGLSVVGSGVVARPIEPATDAAPVLTAIAAARVGALRADLPAAVADAAAAVVRVGGTGTVYVVSDRQAVAWENTLSGAVPAMPNGVRTVWIPIGSRRSDNLAVTAVSMVDPPAVVGQPVTVAITVNRFGDDLPASVPITLHAADGITPAGTATAGAVATGASSTVRLRVTPTKVGPQVWTVTLGDPAAATDGLTSDDGAPIAVDVLPPLRVLAVSGDERAGHLRSETSYLRAALSPYATARTGADEPPSADAVDPAQVDAMPIEQWVGPGLDGYQVLVLANVPRLTPQQVRWVEQYVFEGGGLLVAPGSLSDPDDYNRLMHRAGAGILSAALGAPTDATGAATTRVLGLDLSHPVFAFLHRRGDPLPPATIARFFPTSDRVAGATVRGSYASGEPFLIESRWGRGRVMLMTTPIDADWSALPTSGFYLPFVQSMARYLASAAAVDRNLRAGDALALAVPHAIDGNATVVAPDGSMTLATASPAGTSTDLSYTGSTGVPGVYRMRFRADNDDHEVPFVVHRDPAESDLSPVDDARWATIAAQLNASRVEDSDASIATLLADARTGRELWRPTVLLVIGLGLVEVFLLRSWFGGAPP